MAVSPNLSTPAKSKISRADSKTTTTKKRGKIPMIPNKLTFVAEGSVAFTLILLNGLLEDLKSDAGVAGAAMVAVG